MKRIYTLAALLAAPLAAQSQDGVHVGLQLGSARPLVQSTTVGVYTSSMAGGTGTNLSPVLLPYDRQTPLSLTVGITQGADDFTLEVFSSKKKSSRVDRGASGTFSYIGTSATRLDSNTNLEAQVVDLDWRHRVAVVGSTTFTWGMGLRFGSFKHEAPVTIYNTPGETPINTVTVKGESSAFGLSTGLEAHTQISDRFWFEGGLKVAFLEGNVKGSLRIDDLTPPVTSNIDYQQSGEKVHLFQTQAHARLGMNFMRGFDGYVGYEIRTFDPASTQFQYPGPLGLQIHQVKGFGLAGVTLGATYRF
jgi:hypothetical protein